MFELQCDVAVAVVVVWWFHLCMYIGWLMRGMESVVYKYSMSRRAHIYVDLLIICVFILYICRFACRAYSAGGAVGLRSRV